MFRHVLLSAVAATALAATPAFAQHGPGGSHGGGNGNGGGAMGGMMGGGGMSGGPSAAGLDARMNSMGPANASPTGIAHANPNSVLGTNSSATSRANRAQLDAAFPGTKGQSKVKTGTLSGLTAGTTVISNGAPVGTVQQIRTSGDGTARVVLVQGTNGRLFPIPANKLSYANGVLTTSARLNGVNGTAVGMNPAIGVSQGPMHASAQGTAHANAHSVLAGSGSSPHL